jgi:hypothetical protein
MFRREGLTAAVIVVMAAFVVPASASASPATASATRLGPCTIGNPSSCTARPRPNITLFCGRDRDPRHSRYFHEGYAEYRYYDFRGCRARVSNANITCGQENDSPNLVEGSYYRLRGCLVTFGANRIVVGCESSGFDGGFFGIDNETCGASPVIACDTYRNYRDDSHDNTMTCGRDPVVLRCVDHVSFFDDPPTQAQYCDLVIGPAASPIFSCRFDSATPTTTVADVTGCLTGLGARRA